MTILQAITELLKFKAFATLSDIAKIANVKQSQVLVVVNKNSHLLRINKKTGRIIGFVDVITSQINTAKSNGQVYWHELINYGVQSVLKTKNPKAAHLCESYTSGGFGDCYTTLEILDTTDNQIALEALGITNIKELRVKNIPDLWDNDV